MDETLTTQLSALATTTHQHLFRVLEALAGTTTPLTSNEVAQLSGVSYSSARGALAAAALAGWVSVIRDGKDYRWELHEAGILGIAFRRLFMRRDGLQREIALAAREVTLINTLAAACGLEGER